MSSDNCPVGCVHCANDSAEEAQERSKARMRREEDDANFADQDEEHCPPEEENLSD